MANRVTSIKEFFRQFTVIRWLHRIIRSALNIPIDMVLTLASRSKLICRLVLVVDRQYLLEYSRLLHGNTIYKVGLKKRINQFDLKRQLHRIEKGLIQKDRRDEFGLEYILPTVEILANLKNNGSINNSFFIYACNILHNYFLVTKSGNSNYLSAQSLFNSLDIMLANKEETIEFKSTNSTNMSFEEVVLSRKSVREFTSEKIDKNTFEKAAMLAGYAPSGCNRQPYRYIVMRDKKSVDKFSCLPPGGGGNSFGASALVFVIADHSAFPNTSSSHEAYVDASLASMVFVLALEHMGVSSCFMNWPHIYQLNKRANKGLKLKPCEVIVTTIAVGIASKSAKVAISRRSEVEEVILYYGE